MQVQVSQLFQPMLDETLPELSYTTNIVGTHPTVLVSINGNVGNSYKKAITS